MPIMRRYGNILAASCIAIALVGTPASAAQQLNKAQAVQFLTAKKLTSDDGRTSIWRTNGTYRISGRQGWIDGNYSVANNGQVCWQAATGHTGCFVVAKDDSGYYGTNGRYTWRYR